MTYHCWWRLAGGALLVAHRSQSCSAPVAAVLLQLSEEALALIGLSSASFSQVSLQDELPCEIFFQRLFDLFQRLTFKDLFQGFVPTVSFKEFVPKIFQIFVTTVLFKYLLQRQCNGHALFSPTITKEYYAHLHAKQYDLTTIAMDSRRATFLTLIKHVA